MTKRKASFEAQLLAWGGAAVLAVLVFVLLLVLGGWGIIQAIWMAAVTFLVVGAFNYFVFARPVPPLAGSFEPGERLHKAAAPAPAPKPAPAPAPEPAAAAPAGASARAPGALDAPQGDPDDLKRIKGVGPKLEGMLHGMGIYHFRQIAAWGPDEVAWADDNLEGFKGRVSRDDWVGQAQALAEGREPEPAADDRSG